MHATDLRAAWGAAHIRPVLFVIHVIHKPAQTEEVRTINLPAVLGWGWGITVRMSSLSRQPVVPCFMFVFTRIIHILCTYYRVFIVEAMCNEIVATDDGCFTPRHNINLRKMIPLVPTGGATVLGCESIH